MNKAELALLKPMLAEAQRVLVVSHLRPDGDAIGSVLGLGLALQEMGKDVQMVLADGVPAAFGYLSGVKQVRKKPEGPVDLTVVVDCGDLARVGGVLNGYGPPQLNIDHHANNPHFGEVNLVDVEAVSVTEILTRIFPELGLPFTQPIVDALLTGMITDTIGFRTGNMTAKALRTAADLVERGANLPELYFQGLVRRSYPAVRYWGAGLSLLEREDNLAWATLTLEDRKAAGYSGRDDADLVSFLSTIEEIDVAMIFVEQNKEEVKVSWRSKPGFDVEQVAAQFGGGGHVAASGAQIKGSLEEVKRKVIQTTCRLLNSSTEAIGSAASP